MDIFSFVITVVLITASGALAPGPLFFETITQGTKTGAKSGLIFSIAHTVVEFSLIMLFAFGLITIARTSEVKLLIGILGGIVLILFGTFQIFKIYFTKSEKQKEKKPSKHKLFLIGIIFTGLNPYFIIWWLTVGAQLIIIAYEFAAILGVIFMYICHVWMDYVWLISVAHFSKKGKNILGLKWYKPMMAFFGFILIYFGLNFLIDAIN
jgi:threonine/homoserine/homoserine lactone efflux protein